MSVFTSLVSEVWDVPGAPGQTVTVRKLAPKHLEAARQAQQVRAYAEMKRTRELAGDDFIDRVMATATTPKEDAMPDPLAAYDRITLMTHGVTAWTFDQPISAEAFEDLDDETQDWLARKLLRLARPSLFQSAEDAEAARKNA